MVVLELNLTIENENTFMWKFVDVLLIAIRAIQFIHQRKVSCPATPRLSVSDFLHLAGLGGAVRVNGARFSLLLNWHLTAC